MLGYLVLTPIALFILLTSCIYLGRRWRAKLLAKETGLPEIPHLGQARPDNQKIRGTAVVCGGSIAGLLAARICHNHFERVVIVETEPWLADNEARATQAWTQKRYRTRVLQYRSLQAQQVISLLAYRSLFPKFDEEAEASGVHIAAADIKWCIWGRFAHPPYEEYPAGLPQTCFTSRQGLETLLRRLVLDKTQYPNIDYVVGTVTDYQADATDTARLRNVLVRTDGGNTSIDADLVIDCTGASHTGVKMLKRAGYGYTDVYPEGKVSLDDLRVQYDPKITYCTLELNVSPDLAKRLPIPGGFANHPGIIAAISDARMDSKTMYSLGIDGTNRFHLCTGGWGLPDLPRTLEGIKEFARSMKLMTPLPDWFYQMLDMLDADEQVKDTMNTSYIRIPPACYYPYHLAVNLPLNWIALGDSIMRINPVLGQGITKSIYGIITLNNVLRTLSPSSVQEKYTASLPNDFSKNFFELQEPKIEGLWSTTRLFDYAFKTTVPVPGESLELGSWPRWYMRKVQYIAFTDKYVSSILWHGRMFLSPGIDVLHPKVIMKVLWSLVTNPGAP
ncbi:hypothetical protein SERLA73DRAFT_170728 [Serpula lacrymans var. lacrymans S7.3]|uniref:FAD dependent oxidoreductase domain-containing protein n=1 Tax=Serpula lacrymans var. lacrymans (strain S7.3) TaxID=936435 RepID=F8Q6V1_SERL3|nr:hypothetical protein SERLA73DRAFT_170728 [Serpula lacrymans var. lacrymans S7.3]